MPVFKLLLKRVRTLLNVLRIDGRIRVMIFYTYMWLREDGTPYYVGKGTLTRSKISASKKAQQKGRVSIRP